jgi:ribosomal protein S18 acetylase RimI-like enzyme
MLEIMVRGAEARDAAAIALVHVRSWQVAYRGIVADDVLDALSVQRRERDWLGWLADEGSSTMVAESDGVVVGFSSLVLPSRDEDAGPGTCELAALCVDPDRWRLGIGRALLSAAMDAARKEECNKLTAWVLAGNDAALAFYDRAGFAPDGAKQLHPRRGESVVRLRTSLRS